MSNILRSEIKGQRLKVFVGLSPIASAGSGTTWQAGGIRHKPRVFVGLSGGVDSSVSAALLKKDGYDVTGVFIRVWNPASEQGPTRSDLFPDLRSDLSGRTLFGLCQAADDRLDAMRVCAKLGIPFKELNLEKEYKREVVDYMLREYKAGRTPNPDVFCNRFIKFGKFYEFARKKGADFIATGHYARIRIVKDKGLRIIKDSVLLAGSDSQKDQSYFLWQIRRERLPHILFPVGGLTKPEVRKLAKKFGLITADKKDSQGLCFVGKVDVKEFLRHYIRSKKGKILNEKGKVIGGHDGVFFYTLGERIAVSTQEKRSDLVEERPHYVIAKDIKKNTLTVSHKGTFGELPHSRTEIAIKNCNWISAVPTAGEEYRARVRYRQPLQKCRVANTYDRKPLLLFEKAQIAAPGQSLVLYDGDICLGGGTIC